MLQIGEYDFVEARSDVLRKATFQLRYRIYAEEFGFEKKEDHPHGIETDEFDSHAIHFAALDNHQEVIGTVRLVLDSERGLPIERAVGNLRSQFMWNDERGERVAEISRLAVTRECRRRIEDGMFGMEACVVQSYSGQRSRSCCDASDQRADRPIVALGLYRLMYQAIMRSNITHLFFIADRRLVCTLRRYGFIFHQIADPIEYHGARIPCIGYVEEIEDELAKKKPGLFELMRQASGKSRSPLRDA